MRAVWVCPQRSLSSQFFEFSSFEFILFEFQKSIEERRRVGGGKYGQEKDSPKIRRAALQVGECEVPHGNNTAEVPNKENPVPDEDDVRDDLRHKHGLTQQNVTAGIRTRDISATTRGTNHYTTVTPLLP